MGCRGLVQHALPEVCESRSFPTVHYERRCTVSSCLLILSARVDTIVASYANRRLRIQRLRS